VAKLLLTNNGAPGRLGRPPWARTPRTLWGHWLGTGLYAPERARPGQWRHCPKRPELSRARASTPMIIIPAAAAGSVASPWRCGTCFRAQPASELAAARPQGGCARCTPWWAHSGFALFSVDNRARVVSVGTCERASSKWSGKAMRRA